MKQSVDKQQLLQSCGRLQFISHFTERYSYLDAIRMALEGGCRWIQLRVKGATDEEVRPMAIKAQTLCHHYGAVFIIDDRVELVQAIKADGVHLGKNDMPVDQARQLLGEAYLIGCAAKGPTILDAAPSASPPLRRSSARCWGWRATPSYCNRWPSTTSPPPW